MSNPEVLKSKVEPQPTKDVKGNVAKLAGQVAVKGATKGK